MKGYLFVIFSGILYGTIPIFATLLEQLNISVLEQIVIRLLVSVFLLFLILKIIMKKSLKISKQDLMHIIIFSLLGIALLFSFYLSAAVMVGVTIAVLLLYTQPVYTMILSRFILKEKISYYGIIAVVLCLSGVVLIMEVWSLELSRFSVGYVFGFGAGICYSIYIVYMRYLVAERKIESNVVTFWSFFWGILWLIPLWLIIRYTFRLPEVTAINLNLTPETGVLLLGFSLLPSLLAYMLFNKGLTYVKSHKAGVLVLLEPVSAIVMGALILKQAVSIFDIIGGSLILSSLVVIKLQKSD